MKQFYLHIILWAGSFTSVPLCVAQVASSGSFLIHADLNHNAVELHKLDIFIRSAFSRPGQSVERIRLTGYSSIDGNYSTNEQLSRERVESFRLYLYKHYPELVQYPCDLAWVGEDWGEFARLVKLSDINEKAEVLEIIRKVPDFQERERLLVKLNGGRAYHELDSTILPLLRRVEIKVEYSDKVSLPERYADDNQSSPSLQADSLTPALSQGEGEWGIPAIEDWLGIGSIKQRKKSLTPALSQGEGEGTMRTSAPRFALKTNTLLWSGIQSDFKHTTPVANVALEYYINRNWSVEAGAMYSYWNYNHNIEFQGLSGYYVEPRFRVPVFSDKLEVFVGAYGRVGDYDQRKKSLTPALSQGEGAGKVTTSSYTGEYYNIGLSAGLSIQLIGGFGIELGVRVGYVKMKAAMYTHENGENWFDEYKQYNKIKITDLNVSLIYRFR